MEAQQPQGTPPPPPSLNVGDALGYGFGALKTYPGPLVVITLVFLVVTAVLNFIPALFEDAPILQAVVNIGTFLAAAILYMGMIRMALKVTAGQEPEVADLFKADHFGSYLGAGILVGLMVGIGLVLCIVPGILAIILFGFFGFLVLDRGVGAIDSISGSFELTKANLGPLFVLGLAVVGLNLAGALVCGFGLLVTYPITIVALGYAYRSLSGEPIAPVQAP